MRMKSVPNACNKKKNIEVRYFSISFFFSLGTSFHMKQFPKGKYHYLGKRQLISRAKKTNSCLCETLTSFYKSLKANFLRNVKRKTGENSIRYM